MIILSGTSDKLKMASSSVAPVDVHASWVDNASGTITPGRINSTNAAAGTIEIISNPASGVQRNVKELYVRNRDASVANTITIIVDESGSDYELIKVTLEAGQTLMYVDGQGFKMFEGGASSEAETLQFSVTGEWVQPTWVLIPDVVFQLEDTAYSYPGVWLGSIETQEQNYLLSLELTNATGIYELFSITECPALTSLSFPILKAIYQLEISDVEQLSTLNMPQLEVIGASAYFNQGGLDSLPSFSFPELKVVGDTFDIYNAPNSNGVLLPNLTYVGSRLSVESVGGTTFDFSSLESAYDLFISTCEELDDLAFPALTRAGNIRFDACEVIEDLSCPLLISAVDIYVAQMLLTTLDFSALQTVQDNFVLSAAFGPAFTALDLAAFESCGSFAIYNSSTLTTVLAPNFTTQNGNNTVTFQNLAGFTTYDLSSLSTMGGQLSFSQCGAVPGIILPALVTVGSINLYSCTVATEANFPVLTTCGSFSVQSCPAMESISLPYVPEMLQTLELGSMPDLHTTDFGALTHLNGLSVVSLPALVNFNFGSLALVDNGVTVFETAVVAINLSALVTVGSDIQIGTNNDATSIDLSVLETVGASLQFTDMPLLTTISFPALLSVASDVLGTGCALSQASVDAVLVRLAALDGTAGTTTYDNHTIDLSGGTNSTPGATGLTAKGILEGRGNTVTVN